MLRQELSRAELPAIAAPNQLVIRFLPGYNREYEACSDPIRMHRVEENLARITGQNWKIRCELREQSGETPVRPLEAAAPPTEPGSEPLIDKAQSTLGARLLKIDDGFGAKRPESAATDDDADEPDWQDQDEV